MWRKILTRGKSGGQEHDRGKGEGARRTEEESGAPQEMWKEGHRNNAWYTSHLGYKRREHVDVDGGGGELMRKHDVQQKGNKSTADESKSRGEAECGREGVGVKKKQHMTQYQQVQRQQRPSPNHPPLYRPPSDDNNNGQQ